MRIHQVVPMFIIFILVSACSNPQFSDSAGINAKDWLIPSGEVYDGGPGKDGIRALASPPLESISNATYYSSYERVLLYKNSSEVRAYPLSILDWHEIINDKISGEDITVSYCPLTGTGIGMRSEVQQNNGFTPTTFGVSGLLYNSNLILYDRLTDSYWSQMRLQCVGGSLKGQQPIFTHLIETTISTAKKLYPQAQIVSNNTGIYSASQYAIYPYGDYRTNNNSLLFPISIDDNRLPRKERVLGVITKQTNRVYRFASFENSIKVINDELDGSPIVLAGSKSFNFIAAFKKPDAGTVMQKTSAAFPAIMEDASGNIYDIFGEVIEGPDEGTKLNTLDSFMGFWFAFGTFYPGIEIYGE